VININLDIVYLLLIKKMHDSNKWVCPLSGLLSCVLFLCCMQIWNLSLMMKSIMIMELHIMRWDKLQPCQFLNTVVKCVSLLTHMHTSLTHGQQVHLLYHTNGSRGVRYGDQWRLWLCVSVCVCVRLCVCVCLHCKRKWVIGPKCSYVLPGSKCFLVPSVPWRWLGGREGIWPVKNSSGGVLAWLSVWGQVIFAYGPADATATHYLLLQ